MRTLHLYLLRQVLTTLVMTVAVFTFVLMIGSVLKEVLGLLVSRQVSLMVVVQAIGLLIPYVLVFALPMGMLTAALLVFGRFSSDNELVAVRASGISLIAIVAPVLALSVAMSGVCAAINMFVAPQCRTAYKQLLRDVGLQKSTALIPERTFIKDFPGAIVYVSKVDGPYLEDILIYEVRKDRIESYVRADTGAIIFGQTNDLIYVQLTNFYQVSLVEGGTVVRTPFGASTEFEYTNTVNRRTEGRVDLSNLSFPELQRELAYLEERMSQPLSLPVKNPKADTGGRGRGQRAPRKGDLTLPVRVQMHREVAFSFACIGFTLVGIPLGIRAHRRETSFGIAVALLLVLAYYSFFILGQSIETKPELMPHLILWVPNFIFQAVGGVLLWKANRGV